MKVGREEGRGEVGGKLDAGEKSKTTTKTLQNPFHFVH
jgi:hypothetical protein